MKTLDLNTIKAIAEATDHNDHTGAILLLADALENERMVVELQWIDECHEFAGHMNQDLIDDRGAISKIIMKEAQATYTNYNEINFSLFKRVVSSNLITRK